MVVKRRTRRKRQNRRTRSRLNRSRVSKKIQRVRKMKYSRRNKSRSSKKIKRNKKQMGGAAGGGLTTEENRSILNKLMARDITGLRKLISQNTKIWDFVLTCNAPIQVYESLEELTLPTLNEYLKSPIKKLETEIIGKKWWIKRTAVFERLLLRKFVAKFIIDKGLDGILMPDVYAVMVENEDPERAQSEYEIGSLKNELTHEEYTTPRKVRARDDLLESIHAWDEYSPANVVELIQRITTEGVAEPGTGARMYSWRDELYEIDNGVVFYIVNGLNDIGFILLEHMDSFIKMCDIYVGLHIMYLINTFPLDLGGKQEGVNFAVTEEGKCSIIDCEIKGDNTLPSFFNNFAMFGNSENFAQHVASAGPEVRGESPEALRGETAFSGTFGYCYDKNKVGLFNLYYLLLIKELTSENVSGYIQKGGSNFTNDDVTELKTILSGDHFAKCRIPHQFEILDSLSTEGL
jgi:hypothetical protein